MRGQDRLTCPPSNPPTHDYTRSQERKIFTASADDLTPDKNDNHFWQDERLVGSQQPEQLQTSGRHHGIVLADLNTNIYSDLGRTAIATLSPSSEAFNPCFPALFSLFLTDSALNEHLCTSSSTPQACVHSPTFQPISDFVLPTQTCRSPIEHLFAMLSASLNLVE